MYATARGRSLFSEANLTGIGCCAQVRILPKIRMASEGFANKVRLALIVSCKVAIRNIPQIAPSGFRTSAQGTILKHQLTWQSLCTNWICITTATFKFVTFWVLSESLPQRGMRGLQNDVETPRCTGLPASNLTVSTLLKGSLLRSSSAGRRVEPAERGDERAHGAGLPAG